MDVIAMHQAGFQNAVASLGTALTSGHASLMSRYAKEALLTYDSDEAGQKAALRGIPILKAAGIRPRVVNLAPYKDPDELLRQKEKRHFKSVLWRRKMLFCLKYGFWEKSMTYLTRKAKPLFSERFPESFWNFRKSWNEITIWKAFVKFTG